MHEWGTKHTLHKMQKIKQKTKKTLEGCLF
jgi:hypothetical protein